MNNYKNKYLKYKKKYLNLKKIYGGAEEEALLKVVQEIILEQNKNKEEFLNLYEKYLDEMTKPYFEEYHEEFIPIGLEIFEDNSELKDLQKNLLNFLSIEELNKLKMEIIRKKRRFNDITHYCNNQNFIVYMDGEEGQENRDPSNPDNN